MGELWAVSCYFNPAGFRNRLDNYRIFRERLNVPLVTVELGYGDGFALRPADAEILIQLPGRDVMWQKERLLNLAVEAVPRECRKIAWLDCDIVFENDDWSKQAIRRLDEVKLVQLFSRCVRLAQHASPEHPDGNVSTSVVSEWLDRQTSGEVFNRRQACKRRGRSGFAWAARRDLLETHRLYDAAILGSGDVLLVDAALGVTAWGPESALVNPRQRDHYRAWARAFHECVAKRVDVIDSCVYHLWHGDLRNRNYDGRYIGFQPFAFDPAVDLAFDENRCWKWNSEKPEMHQYARDYFDSRREDA